MESLSILFSKEAALYVNTDNNNFPTYTHTFVYDVLLWQYQMPDIE